MSLVQRVNVGRQHSLADQTMARTQTMAKRLGLRRGHLVRLGVWPLVERTYARLARNKPIPPLGRREWEVLDEHLRPEVRMLEAMLERELGIWLQPPG